MLRRVFPLLSLLALTAPAAAQSGPVATLSVAESNFRIAPGIIHLAAGQAVRLNFSNLSGTSHDFSAPAFFAHAQILAGAAPGGEIDLAGHGQSSVTLIPGKGVYKAHCTHFGHKLMGMKATIIVD